MVRLVDLRGTPTVLGFCLLVLFVFVGFVVGPRGGLRFTGEPNVRSPLDPRVHRVPALEPTTVSGAGRQGGIP